MLLGMDGAYERLVKINKCHLSNKMTEDNISELMKSKDSKSTQRAVTRSIKLFRDFLIQNNEPGEFETYTKQKLDEMLRLFYESIRKKELSHVARDGWGL
jgi:hypothetical protein